MSRAGLSEIASGFGGLRQHFIPTHRRCGDEVLWRWVFGFRSLSVVPGSLVGVGHASRAGPETHRGLL